LEKAANPTLTQDNPLIIDARGHRCPVPTLRLQRALAKAQPGRVVRLLADDPMARIDVPHFAANHGVRVLATTVEGDLIIFDVINRA
jgi:tRNA 2-thiouridine synthesizing protein A